MMIEIQKFTIDGNVYFVAVVEGAFVSISFDTPEALKMAMGVLKDTNQEEWLTKHCELFAKSLEAENHGYSKFIVSNGLVIKIKCNYINGKCYYDINDACLLFVNSIDCDPHEGIGM